MHRVLIVFISVVHHEEEVAAEVEEAMLLDSVAVEGVVEHHLLLTKIHTHTFKMHRLLRFVAYQRRFSSEACWDCRAKLAKLDLFCGKCRSLQPPVGTQNAFEVFSLPLVFDLSPKLLERQYLSLQKMFHPDKFALKGEQEKHYADQRSAEVNEAYNVLKDPILRAKHILGQLGYKVAEEDERLDDSKFLMFILDTRERIEEASEDELDTIRTEIAISIDSFLKELSVFFTEKKYDDAKNAVIRLIYLQKLMDEIVKRLPVT
jgi:molecular chaperone HscB